MTDHPSMFAAALRRLRLERGLSYRALADLAHYAKSYVDDLEKGRKPPNPAVAERLDVPARCCPTGRADRPPRDRFLVPGDPGVGFADRRGLPAGPGALPGRTVRCPGRRLGIVTRGHSWYDVTVTA